MTSLGASHRLLSRWSRPRRLSTPSDGPQGGLARAFAADSPPAPSSAKPQQKPPGGRDRDCDMAPQKKRRTLLPANPTRPTKPTKPRPETKQPDASSRSPTPDSRWDPEPVSRERPARSESRPWYLSSLETPEAEPASPASPSSPASPASPPPSPKPPKPVPKKRAQGKKRPRSSSVPKELDSPPEPPVSNPPSRPASPKRRSWAEQPLECAIGRAATDRPTGRKSSSFSPPAKTKPPFAVADTPGLSEWRVGISSICTDTARSSSLLSAASSHPNEEALGRSNSTTPGTPAVIDVSATAWAGLSLDDDSESEPPDWLVPAPNPPPRGPGPGRLSMATINRRKSIAARTAALQTTNPRPPASRAVPRAVSVPQPKGTPQRPSAAAAAALNTTPQRRRSTIGPQPPLPPSPVPNPASARSSRGFASATHRTAGTNLPRKTGPPGPPTGRRTGTTPAPPPPGGAQTRKRGAPKGGEGPTHPLLERCRNNLPPGTYDDEFLVNILRQIVQEPSEVSWDSITGLDQPKKILNMAVIMPMRKPELFKGARSPAKGLLLFGPPGNGKTMVAKAVASQCQATFLSVSASNLTSKWFGDGEKQVAALFAVANALQPSIIFIDEVDSLLQSRSSSDHEASRRIKTEFLTRTEGVTSNKEGRVFIMGATNRPHDLDDAVIRRFTKRVYIPLPEANTRKLLLQNSFDGVRVKFSEADWQQFVQLTEGYSCSDIAHLCQDISLRPLSEMEEEQMMEAETEELRPVVMQDALDSLEENRPSVSPDATAAIERWNACHGSKVPAHQSQRA